jgi:CheY-like chemotaxis protein
MPGNIGELIRYRLIGFSISSWLLPSYGMGVSCLSELPAEWARQHRMLGLSVLIQMIAVDYLEEFGLRVATAGSATEALKVLMLMDKNVCAAIIDVGLPDRRGDALVAEMRAIKPSLPIVIASGYEEERLRDRFKLDERITFLSKPYVAEQLLATLTSLNVALPKTDCIEI